MTEKKLTPKRQRFVDEYPIDFNGTQAAIRAGYSKKAARKISSELLTIPDIQRAIAKHKEKIAERNAVTVDYIVTKLRQNLDRAMQEEAVTDAEGNETGVFKYEGAVANRAIELMGKTIGAFTEKTENKTEVNLNANVKKMSDEDLEHYIQSN